MFTFIESLTFEKILPLYLADDEYAELQQFMVVNPEAGSVIPGSGGIRKLCWKRKGIGKRGGVRIIYYIRYSPNEFWMLAIYAKTAQENVPAHILKKLKEVFENE